MAKAKVKEAPTNGTTPVEPWQVQSLVDQRVYQYLPALFEAMKSIHQELVEIKQVLKEK